MSYTLHLDPPSYSALYYVYLLFNLFPFSGLDDRVLNLIVQVPDHCQLSTVPIVTDDSLYVYGRYRFPLFEPALSMLRTSVFTMARGCKTFSCSNQLNM